MSASPDGVLGVTLVSGFAGAGKSQVIAGAVGDSGRSSVERLALDGSASALEAIAVRAAGRRVGHLVVECLAAADPAVIAAELERTAPTAGMRLDRVVTVVDAPSFRSTMACGLEVGDAGLTASRDDTRTVAVALVGQVEFAQTLIVNRAGAIDGHERLGLLALLRLLNPSARIVMTRDGRVAREVLITGGRARAAEVAAGAGWQTVLRTGGLPVGTPARFDSLVFRSRRPFDEERLWRCVHGDWPALLRGQGVYWLAQRPERVGRWAQVGAALTIEALGRWEVEPQTELVFVGEHLDTARLERQLRACLLDDLELACGPRVWTTWPGPFPTGLEHDGKTVSP